MNNLTGIIGWAALIFGGTGPERVQWALVGAILIVAGAILELKDKKK